jgi:KUP system potassium uptake protein
MFVVMSTWNKGRALTLEAVHRDGVELQSFLDSLDTSGMSRASRVAVYAVADPSTVPQALLHNLKHNQTLHESNVILTVRFRDVPWVGVDERAQVDALGHGFWRVTLNFGFMDTPDVPKALKLCEGQGLAIPPFETSYFLSRETIVPTPGPGMAQWREKLFATMNRNAGSIVEYFRLPDNAVVELGTRVQI